VKLREIILGLVFAIVIGRRRVAAMRPGCRLIELARLAGSSIAVAAITGIAVAGTPAGPRALPVDGVDTRQCIDRLGKFAPARCPPYLLDAVKSAAQMCTEAEGKPVGVTPASIWSLDVNGDGKKEYIYEIGANVGCINAASIFECGSLGCAQSLVQEQKGAWVTIGGIGAFDPGAIEVLPAGTASGYHDLKVNCVDGNPPCVESVFYQWNGQLYDSNFSEVRGFHVDVAGSVHGLHGLTGDTAVLATPTADGKVIARYGPETDVVIIGQAKDYYYVSPCNACESGFVRKSAVGKKY
jgi:hypothetical protein